MIYDRTGTVCRHEGAEFRELHDSYHENHYLVTLTAHELYISDPVFQKLGDTFLDERLRADLANQIEGWEDLDNLTKEEYLSFISDHQIPERLRNALSKNHSFWESYWESVSECAFQMLRDYRKKLGKPEI